MYRILLLLAAIWLAASGCGVEANNEITVSYRSATAPAAELQDTLANYFLHFDDIRNWRNYATDDFIKRAYLWCTGDDSQQASLEDMVLTYYEINKNALRLQAVQVNEIFVVEDREVVVSVTRTWADGSQDDTAYSIVRENGEWKIDNRM